MERMVRKKAITQPRLPMWTITTSGMLEYLPYFLGFLRMPNMTNVKPSTISIPRSRVLRNAVNFKMAVPEIMRRSARKPVRHLIASMIWVIAYIHKLENSRINV
eukprot:scpid111145/ scgid5241/ 